MIGFFGICLLAIGILLAVPIIIFAFSEVRSLEDAVWVAGAVVVDFLLITASIALIRRAEDRAARDATQDHADSQQGDLETNEPFATQAESIFKAPRAAMERTMGFNLNRLNWIGWLLFFASLGVCGLVCYVVVVFFHAKLGKDLAPKVGGFAMLASAIGCFFGTRWLLNQLGVTIYRSEDRQSERSRGASRQRRIHGD